MSRNLVRSIVSVVGIIFVVMLSSISANAAEHIKGYVKKDGKYVASHYRTKANKTQRDNWSSKGNTNPYTGKQGTKEPKK